MGMNISQNYDEEIIPVWTLTVKILLSSLVAQSVKRLPTMRETRLQTLGQEDPLEKEMATHSSTLAWKIPWMEERGRLQSMGSQRVRHDWATSPGLGLILRSLPLLFPPTSSHNCHLHHHHSCHHQQYGVSSVQFSRLVMSDSWRPHESQHARPPCPSPTPGVHSDSMSIESVMPSSHLILCRPLLLLPQIPPSIRVFSNESTLHMVSDHPNYGPIKCVRNRESARFNLYNLRQGIHCQMVTS